MVLFRTTWNCTGNEKFRHPQITNNTHKCSFSGCNQKCPPYVNFLLWLKGDNSEELYKRKIIVWSFLGVVLSLFCYSLSRKVLEVIMTNKKDTLLTQPGVNYACITDSSGIPTTVAQSKQWGDISIIRWTSDFGSGIYNPQSRCEEVSANLQKYYEQGVLKYITTGRKNDYDIICVSRKFGGECLDDASQGQIWTVKSEDNASEIIRKLREKLLLLPDDEITE